MNILELPVLGSQQNQMEKIYSLLSDRSLRSFEGFDLGILELDKDSCIYYYFLNQENENYHYLWDLVIPHALGCLLVFDWLDPKSIERNLRTIDYIEGRFSTPLHICSLPAESDIPDDLIREELEMNGERRLYPFDPGSKDSAKQILLQVLRSDS
jgi:hypothetical protein